MDSPRGRINRLVALIDNILVIPGECREIIDEWMNVNSLAEGLIPLNDVRRGRNRKLDVVNRPKKIRDECCRTKIEVEGEVWLVRQWTCKASIREKASLICIVVGVPMYTYHWKAGWLLEQLFDGQLHEIRFLWFWPHEHHEQ